MNQDQLTTLLDRLSADRAELARDLKQYIDAKLDTEFDRVGMQSDHLAVMLVRILDLVGDSNPDYMVTSNPDGSKTITVRPTEHEGDS